MKSAFVISILCLCIGTVLSRRDDILWRLNSRQEPLRDLKIEEIKLPSRGHHELKNGLSDLHGNSKLRRLSESSNAHLNVLALENVLESLQNRYLERDIQPAKGSRQEVIDIEIENRSPSITLAEKISLRDRDNLKDSRRGLSRLENTLNLLRDRRLDRNVRQNKNSQPVVIDEEVEIIVPKSRGRHKSSLLQLDDLQTINQNSLVVENLLDLLRKRNSDRETRENKNSQLKVIDEKVEILVPKSRRQKSSLRQLDDLQNSNQNLLELVNALDLLRKRNLDREVRDNKDSQLEIIDKEVEIIVPKSRRQKSSLRNTKLNSLDHDNVLDLLRKRNLDREVRENKDSQLEVIDEKVEIIVPNSRRRRRHKSSLHELDDLQITKQNSLDLENALDLLRKRNLDREIRDNKDSQLEVIDEKVEIIVPKSRRLKSSLPQLGELNDAKLEIENALDLLRNRNFDREIRENKNSQVEVIDEKVEIIVPKSRRLKSSLPQLGELNDAKLEIENALDLLRNRNLDLNSDPIILPKTLRHSSRHADSYDSQAPLLKLAEIIGVPKSVVIAKENPSNGLSSKLNSNNEYLKITEIVELLKPKIKGHKQNELAFLKDILEDPILKLDEVISRKRSNLPRLRLSANKINDLDIEDARIEAAKIVDESKSEIIAEDQTSILELVELIANERKPSVRLSSGLDIENARLKVAELISVPKSVRITKEQRIPSKTIVSKHASRTPYEIDVVTVEERDETNKKVLPNLSLVIQTPESPISKHDSSVLRNSVVADNAIIDAANAVSAAASALASAGSPERSREHSASINNAAFIASSAANKAVAAATLAAEAAASAAQAMAYVIDSSDKNSDNPPLVISAESLVAVAAALADAQASETRAKTVAITSANTAPKRLPKAVVQYPIHIPTNKNKVLAKKVSNSNAESSSSSESSSVASSSSATSSSSSSELLQPKNHHRDLSKFESDIILASLALAQARATEAKFAKSVGLGSGTTAAATTITGSGGSGSGAANSAAASSSTGSGASGSGAATSNTASGGTESKAAASAATTYNTGSTASAAESSSVASSSSASTSAASTAATSNTVSGSSRSGAAAATSNTRSGGSGSEAVSSVAATSYTGSGGSGSEAATSAAASSSTGSGASGSGAATSAAATSNTASGGTESRAEASAATNYNTGSTASAAKSSSVASSSSTTSSLSSSELHQSKNNRRELSKFESDIILASLALAQAQAGEAKSQANSFVVSEQTHDKSTLPLLKSPKSPGIGFGTDRTNGSGSAAATSTTGSGASKSESASSAAATSYTGSSSSGSEAATYVAATSNTGSGASASATAISAAATSNTETEYSGSEGAASAAATSNIASGASSSEAAASTSATSSAAVSSGTESVTAASTAATSNTGSSDSGSGAASSAAATSTMEKSNNSRSPNVTFNTSSTASSSQSGSSSAGSTASSTTTGSASSSASSSITSLSNSNVEDISSKFPDKDSFSPKITIIETEDKDEEEVVIVVGTRDNEDDDQD